MRERGRAAWTKRRVLPLRGELEVLRIVFEAAHDEQSLSRPVTNSSPSRSTPRSPVRRNGPSPLARRRRTSRASRSRVANSRRATLGDATQISPIAPSAHGSARCRIDDHDARAERRRSARHERPRGRALARARRQTARASDASASARRESPARSRDRRSTRAASIRRDRRRDRTSASGSRRR